METDWHDLSGNRQLILEVLADQDNPREGMPGSAIKQRLEEEKDRELYNSFVYPNLDALEERGLVRRDDDVKAGQAKQNYLTPEGAQLLQERAGRMNRLARNLTRFQKASEVRDV